ncbi:hypothetical protein K523DRAFT_359292 [Schizophyllum commune Tattone D]|nr:hypothetical protein K523DRAFT_359292 [Schizophyllum commune Tattone D]
MEEWFSKSEDDSNSSHDTDFHATSPQNIAEEAQAHADDPGSPPSLRYMSEHVGSSLPKFSVAHMKSEEK